MLLPGKPLSKIYWCTQLYIEKKLEEYGIGMGEASILMILERKSMSQKEIAEKIHVDKTTVSREVKKLVKVGYVTVKRDEKDGRRHVISLTEKGRKILPEIESIWREWKGILFQGFTPFERKFIIQSLKRMEKNAIGAMEASK